MMSTPSEPVVEDRPPRAKSFDVCWFGFWFVSSALWCLAASQVLGVTGDEKFYIRHGLGWWRGETFRVLTGGTMPLPVDVQTLPVYLWELARGQRFDYETQTKLIVSVARAGNLVFWFFLLFYGWRTAPPATGSVRACFFCWRRASFTTCKTACARCCLTSHWQ